MMHFKTFAIVSAIFVLAGCAASSTPPPIDLGRASLVASVGHDQVVQRYGPLPGNSPAVAKLTELLERKRRPYDAGRDAGYPDVRIFGPSIVMSLQPDALIINRFWTKDGKPQENNTVVDISHDEFEQDRKLVMDSLYDQTAEKLQDQANHLLHKGMTMDEVDAALAPVGASPPPRSSIGAEEDEDYEIPAYRGYVLTVHAVGGSGVVWWVAHKKIEVPLSNQ